jgi:hypothetical protein
MSVKKTKIRTASDLWTLIKIVGCVLCLISVAALMLVKHVIGAVIILALPAMYLLFAFLIIRMSSTAMVLNVISSSGIKNMRRGEPMCSMQWDDVGDFGIAEAKKGIFSGKYIYLSRVFVRPEIRQDIIKKYDPRVCIVLPCTDQICSELKEASKGKVDIK